MKEAIFKYNKKAIRLCLFKAVLFFSVFAFSGYNVQAQNAFHESVKTELVESRNDKVVFSLKNFTKDYSKISFTKILSDVELFSSWTLLNFNQSIAISYKSLRKKNLSYNISSIILPIKTALSSSEDDLPQVLIG